MAATGLNLMPLTGEFGYDLLWLSICKVLCRPPSEVPSLVSSSLS